MKDKIDFREDWALVLQYNYLFQLSEASTCLRLHLPYLSKASKTYIGLGQYNIAHAAYKMYMTSED